MGGRCHGRGRGDVSREHPDALRNLFDPQGRRMNHHQMTRPEFIERGLYNWCCKNFNGRSMGGAELFRDVAEQASGLACEFNQRNVSGGSIDMARTLVNNAGRVSHGLGIEIAYSDGIEFKAPAFSEHEFTNSPAVGDLFRNFDNIMRQFNKDRVNFGSPSSMSTRSFSPMSDTRDHGVSEEFKRRCQSNRGRMAGSIIGRAVGQRLGGGHSI